MASAAVSGAYSLHGRYLRGQVSAGQSIGLPPRVLVTCDGQPLQYIALDHTTKSTSSVGVISVAFEAMLHPRLSDGRAHQIRLMFDIMGDYLLTEQGQTYCAFHERVLGYIDTFDGARLTGWAFDVRDPGYAVPVSLWDGDRELLVIKASEEREDVNQSCGVAGPHGFSLTLPVALFDGSRHSLSLRCLGTVLRLKGAPRFHDGVLINEALVQNAARYVGRVESCAADRVAGWVFDSAQPDVPVLLSVSVDGEIAAYTLANLYQPRLKSVHGSGVCAFRCDIPTHFMNGRTRQVAVQVAGTGRDLPYSPQHVVFPLIDFFGARERRGEPEIASLGVGYAARASEAVPMLEAPKDAEKTLLSMIVLNLDGALLLTQFLASLEKFAPTVPYEVLVVDHGSTDDSEAVVARWTKLLPVVWLGRGSNHSFSASNNEAARRARGDFLLFVNNDIELTQEVTQTMLGHFARENVGAVGVRLLEPVLDGTGRRVFAPHHEAVLFQSGMAAQPGQAYAYFPAEVSCIQAGAVGVQAVPAVTAALMMCRASDFRALGGFCESYVYGLEDVDLCWRLWMQLGKQVVADTTVQAVHYRSYTREARGAGGEAVASRSGERQTHNRAVFQRRLGRQVRDAVLRGLFEGSTLRQQPLRVAFAVTEAEYDTGAGDFFTAMELGEALAKAYGWKVMFVHFQQRQLPGVDVLVAMRHDYPIKEVAGNNPGLVAIAWVRNRVDEWLAQGHVADYDLRFCSSAKAAQFLVAAGVGPCEVMPIATNPARFHAKAGVVREADKLFFTGSYWGAQRDALALLDDIDLPVVIYGKGWEQVDRYAAAWRGWVPYWELPQVYSRAALVLDDAHPVTRDWASLNSRVFDAIACGALPLTNCVDGSDELFEGRLPAFTTQQDLSELVERFSSDSDARLELSKSLMQKVLACHTYAHRALQFYDALSAFAKGRKLKIAIKIGVPDHEQASQWGDYHFAQSLRRALQRQGYAVRVDLLPDWYGGLTSGDDIVLVLRGLSAYEPRPDRINLMWLISHPQAVAADEYAKYDHVFVASEVFAEQLRSSGVHHASLLWQCTDTNLFYPDASLPELGNRVIFVGNSRRQKREAVSAAVSAGLQPMVFGADWEGLIPERHVHGSYVPNEHLRRYYSSAQVVLNDHWPDMRQAGFISNRVFDVVACGGVLVSDHVDAMEAIFGDAVVMYGSPTDLGSIVRRLQKDAGLRQKMSVAGRDLVRQQHSFDARAVDISKIIQHHLAAHSQELRSCPL